ncbi:MAG: hypothetical protein HQL72_00255 [Magnetococcales bacterium]|nr:hypothetical protein [Magnetococcales bacterium]
MAARHEWCRQDHCRATQCFLDTLSPHGKSAAPAVLVLIVMSQKEKTFSDVWYRVADLKMAIRPTVRIRKHTFRGQVWYVLRDPLSNRYYRLRPHTYRFITRLSPKRAVEEVWLESLKREPETAPGQEEVVRLLTQLHGADLLYFTTPTRTGSFFERHETRTRKEMQARVKGFLFFTMPLFNPDGLIKGLLPYVRFFFTPFGVVLWLVTILYAGSIAVTNWDVLAGDSEGVLSPDNLALLYVGFFLVKVFHELGHGLICRHFGGSVNTMGIMFLIFTPMPYIDATSSWGFRSRWKRVLVGGGGMMVEFFLGAMALFVWDKTDPGLVHSLAYNIMFVSTVSTLLLNANPLMRLDGYYILSDLLDIPNLYSRSKKELNYLAERYLLGNRQGESGAHSSAEAIWLPLYGIGSGLYRMLLFSGIALFVADEYLVLGVLIALSVLVSWLLVPLVKFFHFLLFHPRLSRNRMRAMGFVSVLLAGGAFGLVLMPVEDHIRLPGMAEAVHYHQVVNDAPGRLHRLLVAPNQKVTADTPLVELVNPEFAQEILQIEAEYEQLESTAQKAAYHGVEDLETIRKRQQTLQQQIDILQQSMRSLKVRAKQKGIWVAPHLGGEVGSWLPRGAELGTIIDPATYRFAAIVSQAQAAALFGQPVLQAEVRLTGQEGVVLKASTNQLIPYRHRHLPSPALGWFGGGDIPVRMDTTGAAVALEDFFLFTVNLQLPDDFVLFHGQLGYLRLTLPSRPLLAQLRDRYLQFVQGRFKI